jgi:hypothetical protein
LEKQAHKSRVVGVQAKSVNALHILINISREDRDKKRGCCQTSYRSHTASGEQRETQRDFYYPRREDDKVGIEGQPSWHLGLKLLPRKRQVRESGIHQR